MAPKTGRSSNTYVRQTRLQSYIEEGHFILKKGEIHQKEITIINLHAPNVNAPNFITHTTKDLKAYINSNTVVVGDFNTPLSSIDMSSNKKK
jgi:hypothetical protein